MDCIEKALNRHLPRYRVRFPDRRQARFGVQLLDHPWCAAECDTLDDAVRAVRRQFFARRDELVADTLQLCAAPAGDALGASAPFAAAGHAQPVTTH